MIEIYHLIVEPKQSLCFLFLPFNRLEELSKTHKKRRTNYSVSKQSKHSLPACVTKHVHLQSHPGKVPQSAGACGFREKRARLSPRVALLYTHEKQEKLCHAFKKIILAFCLILSSQQMLLNVHYAQCPVLRHKWGTVVTLPQVGRK